MGKESSDTFEIKMTRLNITEKYFENYNSQIHVKDTGDVRLLIIYQLHKGCWKPAILSGQGEEKYERLRLKFRRGKFLEEILIAYCYPSHEGKVQVDSSDYTFTGNIDVIARHYDIARLLKKKQMPLSSGARNFLEQGIKGYLTELRKTGYTEQIIEYKNRIKNRNK